MKERRFQIAVLISGGGSTLKNILEWIRRGDLKVDVGLVISSTAKAGGLEHARSASVPFEVIPRKKEWSDADYSEAVFRPLRSQGVDLVVMGGFLKHVLIPADFENRVINIHPSLIPNYCGAGFYGMKVHSAVVADRCTESGCTVHFVDNQYDHGPIIEQSRVPVHPDDSPEDLQKRVFAAECEVYPRVIQSISEGKIPPI